MNNKVSVIMPAYNVGEYIGESIVSIQNQIYSNWELIIVNDGSTDHTLDIAKSYANNDSRIIIVDQYNQGVSVARNTGIVNATGKYLAFLDGDDLWQPEFLSELVNSQQMSNADLVYCGFVQRYPNNRLRPFRYQYINGNIIEAYIRRIVLVHMCAFIVNKDFLMQQRILFTPGCPMGEDQEFIMKILASAKVQSVAAELLTYRVRAGSACTAEWKLDTHIQAITAYKRVLSYFEDTGLDQSIINYLKQRIAFELYRVLWKTIKHGQNNQQVLRLLADIGIKNDLSNINKADMNFLDRIKYHVMLSGRSYLWELFKKKK